MPASVLALGARRPDRRPDRSRIWRRPERRGAGGTGGSPSSSVTFPTTALDARIYIALGADLSQPWTSWQWEDITRYVRFATGVSLTNWRRDETSRVGPGAGQLVLDNRDGRFCRRNPSSPYYGMLSKNTPIWGTINAGSGVKTRLQHFVNEWPTHWDKSATDCTVQIKTAGILRRLSQGVVLKSPLRNTITGSAPLAYWPMEDGNDATTIASGLSGGDALSPSGGFTFSFVDGPAGSAGALDLIYATAGDATHATVALPSISQFQVEFAAMSDLASLTLMVQIMATTDNLAINSGLAAANADGLPHYRTITAAQSGSDVIVNFYIDGVFSSTTTYTSTTIKPTIDIFVLRGQVASGSINISHLSVRSTISDSLSRAGAVTGYNGELVHDRIRRICGEEHVPFNAASASTVAMGPQPIAKALDILREAEFADGGSLYEVDWGLGFQSTMDRYNAAVGMTLDFNLGQIAEAPEPADDDQRTRNLVTASRPGGSEYTHEVTTGPMGTGSTGPGLYKDSVTVNVQTDSQLIQQASQRTLLGTVDEDRWPSLDVNLAAAPELINTWTGLGFGARVNATNPPSQVAPETIDAIVEGYTERWDTRSWVASLNTSPASPYRVFVLAGPSDDTNPNLGYLVPTTCVLAEDLDTTETGVDITTTPLWSTTAEDWTPGALITVDGEDMTVTAVSGAGNPQTLTVTRSVNSVVKTHPSGATVTFKYPGFLAL